MSADRSPQIDLLDVHNQSKKKTTEIVSSLAQLCLNLSPTNHVTIPPFFAVWRLPPTTPIMIQDHKGLISRLNLPHQQNALFKGAK